MVNKNVGSSVVMVNKYCIHTALVSFFSVWSRQGPTSSPGSFLSLFLRGEERAWERGWTRTRAGCLYESVDGLFVIRQSVVSPFSLKTNRKRNPLIQAVQRTMLLVYFNLESINLLLTLVSTHLSLSRPPTTPIESIFNLYG